MNCGKGESLLSSTFMSLEASVIFWQIENKGGRWIPRVMKGYFLDTLQTIEHTEYITPEPRLSWNQSMLW